MAPPTKVDKRLIPFILLRPGVGYLKGMCKSNVWEQCNRIEMSDKGESTAVFEACWPQYFWKMRCVELCYRIILSKLRKVETVLHTHWEHCKGRVCSQGLLEQRKNRPSLCWLELAMHMHLELALGLPLVKLLALLLSSKSFAPCPMRTSTYGPSFSPQLYIDP